MKTIIGVMELQVVDSINVHPNVDTSIQVYVISRDVSRDFIHKKY